MNQQKGVIRRLPTSTRDRIELQCEAGHVWTTKAASVLYEGTWCPQCSKNRLVADRVNSLASILNLDVVSIPENHSGVMLKLKCSVHGVFDRAWRLFRACAGCRECGFEHIAWGHGEVEESSKKIAEKNNGHCLVDSHCEGYAVWQCEEGHVFERSFASVAQGKFCETCMRSSDTMPTRPKRDDVLNSFREKVAELGGVVIGISADDPRRAVVECGAGHQWTPWISNVLYKGTWCKECKNQRAKAKGLKHRLEVADRYGLTLVRSENGKHSWSCENGHEFECTIGELEATLHCPLCPRY